MLRAIGPKDVEKMLATLAAHLAKVDREALKEMLGGIAERIELDPAALTCRIHYRIQAGDLMASPRRADQIPGPGPVLRAVRPVKVA